MYNEVSEALKAVVKGNVITTKARLTFKNFFSDSSDLIIDKNISSEGIKLTDYCYDSENGKLIGTAATKELEVEIINKENYDLADKEFELDVAVLIDRANLIYEYIPYGKYIVMSYEDLKSSNKYKIIANDLMVKLNPKFKENTTFKVTYPITAKEYYRQFMESYGIEVEEQELTNGDFLIENELNFEENTGRYVLGRLAELFGSFAKVNRNNKCQMYLKTETNEVIETSQMNSKLEINNRYGPVNVVTIGLSQVEGENVTLEDGQSIIDNGETTIRIDDNPFLYTEELREKAIRPLFNRLKGFTYIPVSFKYKALLYSDCGDAIQVRNIKSKELVDTIILNQDIVIPATRQSSISSPALTNNEQKLKYISESKQAQTLTEIMVNKHEKNIKSIVSEIGDRTNKETSITEDIDSIEAYVKNNIDITNEITGTDKIILENSMNGTLLSLHIYGNNTVFASLLPNDDLLPSDDLLPYGEESLIKVTRQELDDEGKITSEELEVIDLGVKLALRQKDGVYDEYVLENGKAKVIRRIGVLDDQTTFIRETPIIEDLGTLEIKTARGNTIIEILNYTANMMADYVVINQYTETFSTTVDVMAMIKILEQNIMLEVNKKVNDENIIASINLAVQGKQGIIDLTGNIVRITADYFKLDENGKITCTSGEIGGWNIDSNSLSKEKEQSIQYVRGDIQECELLADLEESKKWDSKYISSLNADSYRKFDFDGDGEITSSDVNTLVDLVNGTERPISTLGKTQINSNDIFSTMTFENDTMGAKTKIGSLGIDSNVVGFKLVFADRLFLSKGIILPIGDGLRQVIPVVSYTNDHNYQFNIENIGDLNFLRTFVDVSDMGHIPIIPVDYKGIQTPIANEKINILTDKGSYMEVQTGTNTYIVQYATSDEKIKKNIKETEINSALKLLEQIDYYSFDLKSNNRHQKIGFKANQLHELDENLTIEVEQPNGEIIYNYDINTIVPLFGKGLKEAYQEIKELKREIENLKKGKM